MDYERVTPSDILDAAYRYVKATKDNIIICAEKQATEQRFGDLLSRYIRQEIRTYHLATHAD